MRRARLGLALAPLPLVLADLGAAALLALDLPPAVLAVPNCAGPEIDITGVAAPIARPRHTGPPAWVILDCHGGRRCLQHAEGRYAGT